MKKRFSLFFKTVLWGFGLIGLSWASDYSIRGAVGQVDFEIATMLTPYGIVNILFFQSDHYLQPYFFTLAKTHHHLFSQPVLFASFIVFLLISLLLLKILKRKNNG